MYALTVPQFFDLTLYEHAALFKNCTFPWEVLKNLPLYLEQFQKGTINGNISAQSYLIDPANIAIGEGTVIEAGAYIQGPCVIGKNCVVRHGAYIRGNVLIGDNCVVGHGTELKNSILLNRAQAAHFAYLGNSILGNRVNLGAGVKCANLRLDRQTISILVQNDRIETGLRKLGAILGDDTQVGCNCVLSPGSLLQKEVLVHPCTHLNGLILQKMQVKGRDKFLVESISN